MYTPRGCTPHICRMPKLCFTPKPLQTTASRCHREHSGNTQPASSGPSLHLRTSRKLVCRLGDLAVKASCILPWHSTYSCASPSHQFRLAHPYRAQLTYTQHPTCIPNLGRCSSVLTTE